MNANKNTAYNSGLTFLENPVSADEIQIAGAMKNYFRSIKTRDLPSCCALFHPDATIESTLAGGKIIPLEEFVELLRLNLAALNVIKLDNLLIRIKSPEEAVVYGSSCFSLHGKAGKIKDGIWKFKKRGDKWLIIETRYRY